MKKSLHRVNWLFCVNGFGQLCVSDPGNILLHFLWIVTVRISFYKFLECLVMLTCIPWNFLEHFIRLCGYDVLQPK